MEYKVKTELLKPNEEVFCDLVSSEGETVFAQKTLIEVEALQKIIDNGDSLYFDFASKSAEVKKIFQWDPNRDTDSGYPDEIEEEEEPEEEEEEELIPPDDLKPEIEDESCFNLMQLEDEAPLEKLDSILEFDDIPKGQRLSESITQIQVGERNEEYKNNMQTLHRDLCTEADQLFSGIINGTITNGEPAKRIVEKFLDILMTDKDILLNLTNFDYPADDDHLHTHAVNTVITALNIATAYGYAKEEIIEIGLGALLSDIGMRSLKKTMRNSPQKYTTRENFEIQKHPIFSANILENMVGLRNSTSVIAYQVHERENGKGYPRGRSKNAIHKFAKIVAVADVFSAISSNRPHRKGQRPFLAMKQLITMGKVGMLDIKVVSHFLQYMSLFPIGSLVKLNDNSYAKVVSSNQQNITRPKINIITDPEGKILSEDEFRLVDLAEDEEVTIVGTADNNVINSKSMEGF
ncbi:MAG: HD domain-containing protein [Fibrobacterales bacterium]